MQKICFCFHLKLAEINCGRIYKTEVKIHFSGVFLFLIKIFLIQK